MSKDIQNDYQRLLSFIKKYSISDLVQKTNFLNNLSQQHKSYFSLLVFSSELKHKKYDPVSTTLGNHDLLLQRFNNYLSESFSEMGSSLFIWTHGCYKVSEQVLRSSIENFFKAIGSIYFEEITQLKNTYEVIDLFEKIPLFNSKENKIFFTILKTQYSELCASVHTASFQNMHNISALGYFPNYSNKTATVIKSRYCKISQAYISICSLLFIPLIKSMHYKNRDIVLSVLNGEIKKRISIGL